MGSIELFAFSASSAFFSLTFFSFFFFPGFEMRVIFLFFYLSYMILESNSVHGKTVSGIRERDSGASSAERNQRGVGTKIAKKIAKAIVTFFAKKIAEKAVEKAKTHLSEKKPEEGKKPLDGIDAWVEEMYEIMDPNMAIETKRRIMTNRLDEKKCAKSKYSDSDSALCIDGKVVGCSISKNLYYYCWHTCGDSYCWTKRLSKYLRCNTWMDCGRDAFLNNAYEIPDVSDSVSENDPVVIVEPQPDSS